MFQKRLQFFGSLLYLSDLALVVISWLAAYYLRFHLPLFPVTKGLPPLELYLQLLILITAVFSVVFQVMGLYGRPWAGPSQVWGLVLRSVAVGAMVAITLTYFFRPYDFSRLVFLHFYTVLAALMLVNRPFMRWLWVRTHPEDSGQRVLVVGIEELGRMMAAKIREHQELGLKVEGFLTRHADLVGQRIEGLPVLGLYSEARSIIAANNIQVVLIALPLSAHDRVTELLENLADEMVDIKIVPDLVRFTSIRGSVEEFEGLPIIGLRGSPLEGWARVAKRTVDLVGSTCGLVLLSPLIGLLALGVKFSSSGPVFYRQKRMGMDGRVFTMYKFRSMRVDAEKQSGPVWCRPDDDRRTKFGSFIRKTSLDELPQLFNVWRGEMSLVGPRPERPEFISDFRNKIPRYMLRHKMKAGITGWAQVHGWRGNTSLERRIEHDLYYIENWSVALDMKIIALTVVRGFVNPHAY